MAPHRLSPLLVATLLLGIACDGNEIVPSAPLDPALAPADGGGHKQVFPVHVDGPLTCPDGTVIERVVDGWIQVRIFDAPGRNVELDVFHLAVVFSNSSGQVYRFEGVGPSQYYLDGNDLVVASAGRFGPDGLDGRLVIDLTTGEVTFVAGHQFGSAVAVACEKLN
jgi:hypothetical protein